MSVLLSAKTARDSQILFSLYLQRPFPIQKLIYNTVWGFLGVGAAASYPPFASEGGCNFMGMKGRPVANF